MKRIVNGNYTDPKSTRDILGISPFEFATIVTALQRYYHQSNVMKPEINKILNDINQPYEGAEYPVPNPHIQDAKGN